MKYILSLLLVASLLACSCSSGKEETTLDNPGTSTSTAEEPDVTNAATTSDGDHEIITEMIPKDKLDAQLATYFSDKDALGNPCRMCACSGYTPDPSDPTVCITAVPNPPPGKRCQHSHLNHPAKTDSFVTVESKDGGAKAVASTNRVLVKAGGKIAFMCSECGKVMAICDGGKSGQRCLWCSSPTGRCKCPHCPKEYYEVSHLHF